MVQMSGTNERFLQSPTVLSEILRVMEPDLAFMDVIPMVDSGGQPVVYGKKAAKSSDAMKQTPQLRTPSSKFPEIQFSRMTKDTAILNKEGLAIRIDEDALRLPAGADMIMDAYQNAGYWLAEYMNSTIYTIIRAGGTDAGMTPTAIWSDEAATPMTDLRTVKNAMKREGYPYRVTDFYVYDDNLNELEEFLSQSDIAQYRDAALNSSGGSIVLPMEGKPVIHGLFSGVSDGELLAVDRTHQTWASMYYWNDPKYSVPSISYQTVTDGKPVTKTVPNFGLNTYQYFEDDTHDTVIQVWMDYTVKVKDAYGCLYDDGL